MSLRHVEPVDRKVLLSLIDPPALASRTAIDEGPLEELAADIREKGLINPIILAPVGERFEVIAGHRRYLACFRAGLYDVPARIYPDKTAALIGVQYSENRFRQDLNPLEEAVLFAQLLEDTCGGDVDVLCSRLGERRGYVEGRLALLELDDETREALGAGKVAIGVAQQLAKVTDLDMRRYYLDAAVRGGATVTVVSGWVQQWLNDFGGAKKPASPTPATPAAPSMVPANPFTCLCCGRTDNTHLMQPLWIHQYCKLAILDPVLEQLNAANQDPRRI